MKPLTVMTRTVKGMAAYYEIRIKGRIGESLLAKIQSLGLEVVELRRLPAVDRRSGPSPPPPV
jgi:hypothetical protein